jgi:hypothetical protein
MDDGAEGDEFQDPEAISSTNEKEAAGWTANRSPSLASNSSATELCDVVDAASRKI